MRKLDKLVSESELASLAKRYRLRSKRKRAHAARDMGVSQTSIFHAEESPHLSLSQLRMRMLEAYSPYDVAGTYFLLKRKKKS